MSARRMRVIYLYMCICILESSAATDEMLEAARNGVRSGMG